MALIAVLPPGAPLLGLAVDIGTTKVAAYLLDLSSGVTLAKAGAMNPQIGYGEDAGEPDRVRQHERHRATGAPIPIVRNAQRPGGELSPMPRHAGSDCGCGGGRQPRAMHHLFAGLPVRQLGEAPYVAVIGEARLRPRASDVGLHLSPGANAVHAAQHRRVSSGPTSRGDACWQAVQARPHKPSWRWTLERIPRSAWLTRAG